MATDHHGKTTPTDVRMRGFASRVTVKHALGWLDAQLATLPTEQIATVAAAGRVLGGDVTSDVNVPGFTRSMMDGFAVKAADTEGATSYNRLPLEIVGAVFPGDDFSGALVQGQAIRIMTGAAVPTGADAVLPFEKSEIDGQKLFALDQLSPGKNIGLAGEDVAAGDQILSAGRMLRPQDIGVLVSIGVGQIDVVRRPRVRIVITGNELLPPGSKPAGCKIVDSNSPMLGALVTRDGGIPINPGIVADEPDDILAALHDKADVVLVSGGSSVGQEDHAPNLLATHGELAIHGIAMRPSSPAGMGRLGDKLVFLLPGNPVSCLCAYDFFAGRAIRAIGGRPKDWPYRSAVLPLQRKLVSAIGRVDYARVKIENGSVEPLAISGASVLSSTTRADGFVIVPGDSEGFPPGADVQVFLYDA